MKRRRRRSSSRRREKWRLIMLVISIPCLLLGATMLIHPALRANMRIGLLGVIYLLCGCTILAVHYTRRGCEELRHNASRHFEGRSDSGAALITVLILCATLAAITLHAQALTHATLRLTKSRRAHWEMSDTAMDVTFYAIQELSTLKVDRLTDMDADTPFVTCVHRDAGYQTEVYLSQPPPPDEDTELPDELGETAAPPSGTLYTLRTTIRAERRRRDLLCEVDRRNDGQVTIRRWVER